MAPLFCVIKIVKYCGVVGRGGGALVALKSYKHNGAPSLSLRLLSIVTSGEGGGGGIGGRGRQNPTKIMALPFSVIKIVKYCGVVGAGVGALVALKSYKHNCAPSLSLRLLSIVTSGEGGGGGHWGAPKSYKK